MQSKKRFTETSIWESSWFSKLDTNEKLFWVYLNHRCDNIGLWDPNLKLAAYHLDLDEDPNEFGRIFLDKINQGITRIILMEDNKWFLKDFVKFQFVKDKPLNPRNPAHKSYLQQISESSMMDWFLANQPEVILNEDEIKKSTSLVELSKTSLTTLQEESDTYKDKEIDKEKEKEEVMDREKEKKMDTEYNPFNSIDGYSETVKRLTNINPYFIEGELHNQLDLCDTSIQKFLDLGWHELALEQEVRGIIRNSCAGSFYNVLRDVEDKRLESEVISDLPKTMH